MSFDNYGGIHKIEVATVGGSFAELLFTLEAARLTEEEEENENGHSFSKELTFSYPAEHAAQNLVLDELGRTKGVKARVTDNNLDIHVLGTDEEPYFIAQNKDTGQEAEGFNSWSVRIYGTTTCQ